MRARNTKAQLSTLDKEIDAMLKKPEVIDELIAYLESHTEPSEFLLKQYQEVLNQRQTMARMLLDPASPYHKAVRSAIFRHGGGFINDIATDPEDLFSEIAAYLATHAEDFQDEPGNTASLSTRIYALAKRWCHTAFEKTRYRWNLVAVNPNRLYCKNGCETLSKSELLEQRQIEMGQKEAV